MRLNPETAKIERQLLDVLDVEYPVPISTMQLCRRIQVGRWSHKGVIAYRRLDVLARRGVVERIRLEGFRDVFWRGGRPVASDAEPTMTTAVRGGGR